MNTLSTVGVAVRGSAYFDTACILAQCGLPTWFVADDAHDAARLDSVCEQFGVKVSVPPSDLTVLGRGGLSLSWAEGDPRGSIHISRGAKSDVLIEVMGADRQAHHLARMIEGAGVAVLHLRGDAVPVSGWYQAYVSLACEQILLTGSTPLEIDAALEAAGFAIGPFAQQDLVGVDTQLAARSAVFARHGVTAIPPIVARAVAEGRLGRKVGVGWYRYPGGAGPVEDPLVEDLAAEEAHFLAHPRRDVSGEEVVMRVCDVIAQVRGAARASGIARVDLQRVEAHLFGPEARVG